MTYTRVFVAEKPLFAEAIAKNLGRMNDVKPERKDGYWSVGTDAVAFYFGHMFSSAKPEEYGFTYSIPSLPYLVPPENWSRSPASGKEKQVRTVQGLLKKATAIVNCGDAGREGQLLVDEGLQEAGIDPFGSNISRLWVQSFIDKDIENGLNNLFPNSEKRRVFESAFVRQIADWQHGMTLSTLYNILARNSGYQNAKISVGRVQTPTLRLVVDRDRERASFKPVDHFLPVIVFNHENGTFKASYVIPENCEGVDSEGRLTDKGVAQSIIQKIAGKDGTIESYKSENKLGVKPLGFSLSALQTKCGKAFGLTAKETLDVAQALYEKHKLTTYPRSDCQYLPTSMLPDVPGILENLKGADELASASNADTTIQSRIWNDKKVEASDHHAIVPTVTASASKLNALSDIERKVFILIAQNFIAQFYGPYKYVSLSAEVMCAGETFRATGKRVTDMGWKAVYQDGDEDDDGYKQSLPDMKNGDTVHADAGEAVAKRTSPPPAFTDGSLINAMTNAHKFETNPELKKRLKEGDGIGTEATRSGMIELLLDKGFLKRKGKDGLESTAQGQSLIDVLPPELSSVGLTALWEEALNRVESGETSVEDFLAKQGAFLKKKIEQASDKEIVIKGIQQADTTPMPHDGEKCPVCEQGTLMTKFSSKKGKRYLACSRMIETPRGEEPPCKFFSWDVKPIAGDGKECSKCQKGHMWTCEYTKKGERKATSYLRCNRSPLCDNAEFQSKPKVDIEKMAGDGEECKKCHQGHMITRGYIDKKTKQPKAFLKCDNQDCGEVIWDNSGKSGGNVKWKKKGK